MEPTINTPIEAAAAALATAVDVPMTATGEETLTLVRGLAQIGPPQRTHRGRPGPLGGLGHRHTTPATGRGPCR
ncbi:MAG: hypothetical protein DLM61_06260 [Pseudonocardiales bacterium]|nr:MAG: hypothetical protein DLM61_06260 [Pseudonocardiales bacterium]